MNLHKYFAQVNRPVEACVVGSGGFGRSFLAQCLRTPLLNCRIAIDLDADTVVQAMISVGIPQDRIRVCADADAALAAWSADFYIAASDLAIVAALPIAIVVEATGNPEAGARHARIALEAGLHVAMVSKEVDSVVGPGIAHLAQSRGLVVTPVDGDQPSLLIGLITWAQVLGLEIVAAGKASEYDFVFDPETGRMSSNGVVLDLPEFSDLWKLDEDRLATVKARAHACRQLPQRAVPDFCEMLVVANSTGMVPDTPSFNVPILRIPEVPEVLRTREEGGLLSRENCLELFHCLRKPDELSFAGGVFLVVRCHDAPTWALLAEKGHVVSADQKTAMVYLPRHLLGLEAATSVIEAGALGVSSGASQPRPVQELVGKATTFLPAGTQLTMGGHHHSIRDVAPVLLAADALADERPAPFYLIANRTLVRDVAADTYIRLADVDIDPSSALLGLRHYQDGVFFNDPHPSTEGEQK